LDDLLGELLTYKIHLKEDEADIPTKKGVAFKTKSKDFNSSEDNSSDEDEESMTTIVHGLKKMFKSKRIDPKKILQKGFKEE